MPSSDPAVPVEAHKLYGGLLCLDFANTVEPRVREPRRDHLRGYADLVRWARHAGALDDAQAQRLLAAAATRRAAARTSFIRAIALREAIYRAFAAIAQGATPAAADLDRLQRAYAAAMRHAHLLRADGRLAWTWDDQALDLAWWPAARSAVELATAGPLERLKQCPAPEGCGWLFLDGTKNRLRRWCSMEECGGQAKARRQTARRRVARATAR
ncbi:MAG TPA: ABATE domain-containing protein [Actinomycetes bacterium]|jgi:predicted RNA-binding Zn ribbon-like protein|nr:ABATE domain-containing protein [Actinomycetes bacterium]